MHQRVMDIVNLIAQYVMNAENATISEQELMSELMAVGFEPEEINDAFDLMETITLRPAEDETTDLTGMTAPTFRVFTNQEKNIFTSKAQGFLIKLRAMGLINDDTQEEIIDRALRTDDSSINEQEIKMIAVVTLMSRSNNPWQREIDCFLENDWSRIYH